jgi:hypothetical protein
MSFLVFVQKIVLAIYIGAAFPGISAAEVEIDSEASSQPKRIRRSQLEDYWIPEGLYRGHLGVLGPQEPGYAIIHITIGPDGNIDQYQYLEFHRQRDWLNFSETSRRHFYFSPSEKNPGRISVQYISSRVFSVVDPISRETEEIVEERRLHFEERLVGED